jgi:outer membrane protein assembly factor BamB
VRVMTGGDVLLLSTVDLGFIGPNTCADVELLNPGYHARFARLDGIDGSMKWVDIHKPNGVCEAYGYDIVGISDGRVYAFVATQTLHFYESGGVRVLQYDEDGTLLTSSPLAGHMARARVTPDDRIFIAGEIYGEGFVSLLSLDDGHVLWNETGMWGTNLHQILGFDVFANEEFAVSGYGDLEIARVTQDQQVIWSAPIPDYWDDYHILEIGGPDETVAGRATSELMGVYDSDGTPRWETAADSVAIDPNGDVFVINDDVLEKHAGADGALICSTVLSDSGYGLVIDEDGAPVVSGGGWITKYSP